MENKLKWTKIVLEILETKFIDKKSEWILISEKAKKWIETFKLNN